MPVQVVDLFCGVGGLATEIWHEDLLGSWHNQLYHTGEILRDLFYK